MSDESKANPKGGETGDHTSDQTGTPAAHKVIEAFGGIRPMAQKLGVAASTVQGWKERGVIPPARQAKILEIAKAEKMALDEATVAASAQMPDDPTEEPKAQAAAKAEASAQDSGEQADANAAASAVSVVEATPDSDAKASGAATAPQPAASGGSGWQGPFAAGVLVLAVGIGIAVVGRTLWLPLVDDREPGNGAALSALEQRIAALESDSGASQALGALEGDIAALARDLEAVRNTAQQAVSLGSGAVSEQTIAALQEDIERRLAQRGESLDQIVARLERVESHQVVRPVATEDLALTLALGSLRERIYRGQPFQETLAAALDAAGPRPGVAAELEPLREASETGVLRLVRLQESFRQVSRDIVAASAGEGEENPLLAGIKRRLSQVVTIRPSTENAAEGSPELAVGLAEDALAAGNLADALAALEGLPESGRAAGEPWITEATRRLEAEQAVEAATTAFLADLEQSE